MGTTQFGYSPNRIDGTSLQFGRVRKSIGAQVQMGRYRVLDPFSFRGDVEGTRVVKRTTDRQPELRFQVDAGASLTSFTLLHLATNTTYGPYSPTAGAFDLTVPIPLGIYRVTMTGTDSKGVATTVRDRLTIYTMVGKLWRNGQAKMFRSGAGKIWRVQATS